MQNRYETCFAATPGYEKIAMKTPLLSTTFRLLRSGCSQKKFGAPRFMNFIAKLLGTEAVWAKPIWIKCINPSLRPTYKVQTPQVQRYQFSHPKHKHKHPNYKFSHPKYSDVTSATQSLSSDTPSPAIWTSHQKYRLTGGPYIRHLSRNRLTGDPCIRTLSRNRLTD